ncbi:MAG TPA: hypothetical protein VEH51_13730 [Burkholderiales bacterium]|nr:hypothetical protein [Burkholderiales bacterium]
MRFSALIIPLTVFLLSACASTDTVKEAQGQGVKRSYPYGYDRVYNAVLAAAKAKELEVTENDRAGGRLTLSHGVTALSWGERIAVFISRPSATSTEVEIVSKPVLAPLNFPPDWPKILFDQIDAELRAS